MTRIPYPDISTLSEPVRATLGDAPSNVRRMLALASEEVLMGVGAAGMALINSRVLDPRLRELAILRVGYLSGSRYETFQHEALGRQVGLSEQEIAAIRAGNDAALGEAEAAVFRFVGELVQNVRPGDAALAAVRCHLSDTQVADLVLVTGYYMMVCRFLETTGVELDAQPIDWQSSDVIR